MPDGLNRDKVRAVTDKTPALAVLQVVPALREGGVEQSTMDMARHIRAEGGVPVVASAGGRWADVLMKEGIAHVTLPLDSKLPWVILWNMLRLRRVMKDYRIRIVHARSRGPAWSTWLATRLGDLSCVHYITTFHGTYGSRGFFKKLYNGVMLKGRLVIANSAFIKRHIVAVYGYPAERIVVAARGVDEAVYDPARFAPAEVAMLRNGLQVPTGTPLLLMTGRLTRWKGQAVLLEALGALPDRPWVAAFAGGAKTPEYLEELKALAARLGIAGRVRWLGMRRDVPLLNMAADLAFSCSTEAEAFGRVAIEAQAMGTPVIASALGGSLETVRPGETGWLVPAGNAEALAGAIGEALDNPKRLAAMGKAGRAWVLGHFTAAKCCAAEWSAYHALLAPGAVATEGPSK